MNYQPPFTRQKLNTMHPRLEQYCLQHPRLLRYGANTLWSFADKAVRLLAALTAGVMVARSLAPEEYGQLNYILSFALLFSPLIGMGTEDLYCREMVKYPENIGKYLGCCLLTRFLGGGVMLLASSIALLIIQPPPESSILILIAVGTYLLTLFQGMDLSFQARVLMKYVTISQICGIAVGSGLKILGALENFGVIYFVWMEAVILAMALLVMAVFYWKKGPDQRWQLDLNIFRSMVLEGLILLISGFLATALIQMNVLLLKWVGTDYDAGIFSVTLRWIFYWYFVPMALASALYPGIVSARKQSIGSYHRHVQIFYSLLFYLGIACAAASFFMSYGVELLYGTPYHDSAVAMRLYAPSLIFIFWSVGRMRQLPAEKRNGELALCLTGGVISNILLNLWWIPLWGVTGCALASMSAYAIAGILMPILFFRPRIQRRLIFNAIFWRRPGRRKTLPT